MKRLLILIVLAGTLLAGCRADARPTLRSPSTPGPARTERPRAEPVTPTEAPTLAQATPSATATATPERSADRTRPPAASATAAGQGGGVPNPLAEGIRVPLTDMGTATYYGLEGGLYPGGSNEMPAGHAAEGLRRGQQIQPLDVEGQPDPNGKIVMVSVGMSNTMMEFCGQFSDGVTCMPESFISIAGQDPAVNHRELALLNGARGSQVANRWDSPSSENYDSIRDRFLAGQGLTEQQVQVVWLKAVDYIQGKQPLPAQRSAAHELTATLANIVRALKVRYPNLQQVYLSSRIYAGYATRQVSPEPFAYESGFSVKWLIEAQIRQMESGQVDPLAGDLSYETAPWLAWGTYLWADGANPRSDGLVWLPEDFAEDGTHPADKGREKVARLLLDFFKSSPFSDCWFLAAPDGECDRLPPAAPPVAAVPAATPTIAATAGGNGAAPAVAPGSLIPLTDMGTTTYQGFDGGLYPDGSNEMPAEHAAAGLERERRIQPLAADGQPDPGGEIVLLSIGMSNTSMEFCRALGVHSDTDGVTCPRESFIGLSEVDPAVNQEELTIVNGARGGQVAYTWDSAAEENYDRIRDELLAPLGLSEQQVQIVWLKVANPANGEAVLPSPQAYAYKLAANLGGIARALQVRYPNLQQVFVSSRIYAGYATEDLNPEPYAYESGFAVKWLIEAQIEQEAAGHIDPLFGDLSYEGAAPWLAWGPYLWAAGTNPRSDDLVWLPGDFGNDGTHPSVAGREKVGAILLAFFKSSPFSDCWFLAAPPAGACG